MKTYIYPPQSVAVAVPPLEFLKNGVSVNVEQDTVTPANNNALPSLQFIVKDGVQVPVTKSTGLPSDTVGIPVEIVAASGTPINITAGDISVQLTDMGANFDSTRVGDGSGRYLGINTNNEAKVFDAAVLTEVGEINTKTPALVGGKVPVDTGLSQPLTDTQLRASAVPISGTVTANTGLSQPLTDGQLRASAVPVSVGSLPLPNGAATEAKQDTGNTRIGDLTETAPASDTASSGLNGRLQRIAQRLTSLISLFPTSIGQKTGAGSLSVVLASDQGSIPTAATLQTQTGTITSAQKTVGTSAVRATVSGSAPSASRKKLMIKPSANNSGKIYLGSSGVTTSTGMEIIGPDRLEFPLDGSDYYVISDTASQIVEIIEVV